MKSTGPTETQRKRIPGIRNATPRPGGWMSWEIREETGQQATPGTVGREGVRGEQDPATQAAPARSAV